MPLTAINHLHAIGTEDTRPQQFLCDHDGVRERWVLKLMGLSAGELAADWIGSLLARRLSLQCPAVEIAIVSEAALMTAPNDVRAWARPGPAFASRLVENVTSGVQDIDLLEEAPSETLGRAFALDTWIEVLDRRKPDGVWNLLLDTSDGSLWVLDFGKSLTPCLHVVLGGANEVTDPGYPLEVMSITSRSAALEACDIIESLPRQEIEAIVASVPTMWVTNTQRSAIVRFLVERMRQVRAVCEHTLRGGVA